jgi:DNA invertase Pin-like site-specific DNA recombinase
MSRHRKRRDDLARWAEIVEAAKPDPIVPPAPRCFAYVRVSTEEQAVYGFSLEAQRQSCMDWWERTLKPEGVGWGDFIADEGASAFKLGIFDRPEGARLIRDTFRGDHIVFPIFDRAFRSMMDFVNNWPTIKKLALVPHFIDIPMDLDSPTGIFTMQIRCAFSEFESRMKGARVSAALAVKMARDGFIHCRMGFRIVVDKKTGRNRMVPDWRERAVMMEVVRLRDEEGLGWADISDRINLLILGENARRSMFKDNPYHDSRFHRMYCSKAYWEMKRIISSEGTAWISSLPKITVDPSYAEKGTAAGLRRKERKSKD